MQTRACDTPVPTNGTHTFADPSNVFELSLMLCSLKQEGHPARARTNKPATPRRATVWSSRSHLTLIFRLFSRLVDHNTITDQLQSPISDAHRPESFCSGLLGRCL